MTQYAFTVDPLSASPGSWIHTIRGTKDPTIIAMSLGGDFDRISFPTTTSWQVDVVLSPGDNLFVIQGRDAADNLTESYNLTVTLPYAEPEPHEVFDDMSKHGFFQGLVRLPGEKNVFYLRRCEDAAYYPSAPSYAGLFEAVSRDLGLTVHRTAFFIKTRRNLYQDPVSFTATLEIGPGYALVDADEIRIDDEHHLVDPGFNGFYLNFEPRTESDVRVYTRDKTQIDHSRFKVHCYDRRVEFDSDFMDRQWVRVRYNHRIQIDLDGTLSDLETELEGILIDGVQLFDIEVEDGTRYVEGLSHRDRFVVTTAGEYLKWGHVQIYNLHDQRFRDDLLNEFEAAYDTQLEAWAGLIAKRSKFGWDSVILDVDTWDTLHRQRENACLPHLFDSFRGHYDCPYPDDTGRYTPSEYTGWFGTCPNHTGVLLEWRGVRPNQWHSGIGSDNDLLVTGIAQR